MKLLTSILVCLFVCCATISANAQDSKPTASNKQKVRKEKSSQVSNQRKAELLAFVEKHYPELKEMLGRLEKNKPRSYRQALTGLHKSVKKLEAIKERNPKRYESSLQQWKIDSRIRVASAQLQLKDTEEGRDKLKSLVADLVDFHIERMKSERKQILERLEQLDKRISDAESKREEAIEKKFKAVSPKKKKAKAGEGDA